MPYVQRKEGKISGLYANPQAGFAEDWVDDKADEVKKFMSKNTDIDPTPCPTCGGSGVAPEGVE